MNAWYFRYDFDHWYGYEDGENLSNESYHLFAQEERGEGVNLIIMFHVVEKCRCGNSLPHADIPSHCVCENKARPRLQSWRLDTRF